MSSNIQNCYAWLSQISLGTCWPTFKGFCDIGSERQIGAQYSPVRTVVRRTRPFSHQAMKFSAPQPWGRWSFTWWPPTPRWGSEQSFRRVIYTRRTSWEVPRTKCPILGITPNLGPNWLPSPCLKRTEPDGTTENPLSYTHTLLATKKGGRHLVGLRKFLVDLKDILMI